MRIFFSPCDGGVSGKLILGALMDAGASTPRLGALLAALPGEPGLVLHPQPAAGVQVDWVFASIPADVSISECLTSLKKPVFSTGVAEPVRKVLALFERVSRPAAQEPGREARLPVAALAEIVGVCAALEQLEIEKWYAGALPWPCREAESDPRLAQIYQEAQVMVSPRNEETPVSLTGALLLGALAAFERPVFQLERQATGIATDTDGQRLALRGAIGRLQPESPAGMVLLQTNIDDMSPQFLGRVVQQLMAAGARDVYQMPVYMKKNRLGTRLSVVARKEDEARLAHMILRETSTFGMHIHPLYHRYQAERRMVQVETAFGAVMVKQKVLDGEVIHSAPEYEVCAALAEQHHVPLAQVYQAALGAVEREQERRFTN
ncbi:MAG: LarC family nickel insertion protein [Chloroflexi bacterium]|nr:LarC family nickel insertion protein [Chloroflexota bacterium]